MIHVNYVCKCGNKMPASESTTYGTKGGLAIYSYVRMICMECGKTMELQITKETQETKVEIIDEGE